MSLYMKVYHFESILSSFLKMYKIWSYLEMHFKTSDEGKICNRTCGFQTHDLEINYS